MKRLFALLMLSLLPAMAAAQDNTPVVEADLRPGWRLPNGDHMAALHLRLAPGWKTYWRTPGDAGIPPRFDWRGAQNVQGVGVNWPAPQVFWQSGMRSVGYDGELVLPLRVRLKSDGQPARLGGIIEIGICKDVCIPHRVRVSAELPPRAKPDSIIAAALADMPFSAAEAGVRAVTCRVAPAENGMALEVQIDMPEGTGHEETVIEMPDPELWVADPDTRWQGGRLMASTRVSHMSGKPFALDRSGVTITVIGGHMPVEIRGCTG